LIGYYVDYFFPHINNEDLSNIQNLIYFSAIFPLSNWIFQISNQILISLKKIYVTSYFLILKSLLYLLIVFLTTYYSLSVFEYFISFLLSVFIVNVFQITYVYLKNVNNFIKIKSLTSKLNLILNELKTKIHGFKFTKIKFLCINPHCGENNTLGHEDNIIKKCLLKFKNISGPYAADSAFNNIESGTLYISTYHDQALIPFKIINKKSVNLTIGLDYRRFSPTHGTAADIKYKNLADNTSYIECMKF